MYFEFSKPWFSLDRALPFLNDYPVFPEETWHTWVDSGCLSWVVVVVKLQVYFYRLKLLYKGRTWICWFYFVLWLNLFYKSPHTGCVTSAESRIYFLTAHHVRFSVPTVYGVRLCFVGTVLSRIDRLNSGAAIEDGKRLMFKSWKSPDGMQLSSNVVHVNYVSGSFPDFIRTLLLTSENKFCQRPRM